MKRVVTILILVLMCGCAPESAEPDDSAAAGSGTTEAIEANEDGALLAVREIAEAQALFFATNRRYALTVDELTSALLLEDDPSLRGTGYTIRMRSTAAADGYRVTAEPSQAATDKRSFFSDASGVIRSEVGQSAGAESPALEEESSESPEGGPSS